MDSSVLTASGRMARLRARLEEFLEIWGLRPLADEIGVRVSSRMTRSLGNARPVEKRITLAMWIMSRPQALIDEVLCHEAAHVAVHVLHGGGCRPHGAEWRDLMKQAGFIPRTRIDVPNPPRSRARRRPRISRRIVGGLFVWMKK